MKRLGALVEVSRVQDPERGLQASTRQGLFREEASRSYPAEKVRVCMHERAGEGDSGGTTVKAPA